MAVGPERSSVDELSLSVSTFAEIFPRDTGGLSHSDIALDPCTAGRAVIADCEGGLWLWKCGVGYSEV